MNHGNPSRTLAGASVLLFGGCVTATVSGCLSMSDMPAMPMPGGWDMPMAWMKMPEQTWAGAAALFMGMWMVMMIAMMGPVLIPMLRRYRDLVVPTAAARRDRLTAVAAGGYLLVWTLLGAAVYIVGALVAGMEMREPSLARAVPVGSGAVVLTAGLLQFTRWKRRHLACCRETGADHPLPDDDVTAWRHGIGLGVRCVYCCSGLTAILVILGIMDLRVMAAVTAAILAERLAPAGDLVARGIGVVTVGVGLWLIAQALGLHSVL